VVEAEDFGLLRWQAGKGRAKPFAQLGILGDVGGHSSGARQSVPVSHLRTGAVPVSLAKAIHGADGGQAPKQGTPVLHLLATRDLQGGEECFLEAFIGVGSVA